MRVLAFAPLHAAALVCGLFFLSQSASAQMKAATLPAGAAPCDIYGASGTPCVAAHSTTRALFSGYRGPLYRVHRKSDMRSLDIGTLRDGDGGNYADAAAQDAFCAKTVCFIDTIYDQTGKGNHLTQAGPGTFKGPESGGYDALPIADMAPITIHGHKAYGVFIMPGMGFRNNNAVDIAVDDEPEGIYYVIDGTHFDSGCCFDYGNSSTNGRAVGTGTMETTYFGTSTTWGRGNGAGPWIMSDMEAGLFSGQDAKLNAADPTIDKWRFVTAVMDGGGGNRWDLRGGNAQSGALTTFYSGVRPSTSRSGPYFPMRKQGGILLGTGGDNGDGSSGTFYEGVMTSGYPTEKTTDAVQASVVAAKYDVQRLKLSPLRTFTSGSSRDLEVTFTNPGVEPVSDLRITVEDPAKGWSHTANARASTAVAAGQSSTYQFAVTSPLNTSAGFLTARAQWKSAEGRLQSESVALRVRSAPAVKINEVSLGAADDPSKQFVELYNGSDSPVDIAGWRLEHVRSLWAPVTLATIPRGTRVAAHGFYLLDLAASGLTATAKAGDKRVYLRPATTMAAGQVVTIDGEQRTLAGNGTAAGAMTTIFSPVSTARRLLLAPGSTMVPVTSAAGFQAGQPFLVGSGPRAEMVTVEQVGKAATLTTLTEAAAAGDTQIALADTENITSGDALTVGAGRQQETVRVASVAGKRVTLVAPLRHRQKATADASDDGTGIRFTPATRFAHESGEVVQPLGAGFVLDRPLTRTHSAGTAVLLTSPGGEDRRVPEPNQWFGEALSTTAGSLALMDPSGETVVDAVVYGSQQSNSSANGVITSPELAVLEGEQEKGGCIAITPAMINGFGTSLGRFPDGADTDSNCSDFKSQLATNLGSAVRAGATNVKVTSVTGFSAGKPVIVDKGALQETATLAHVGGAGSTVLTAPVEAGAAVLALDSAAGFTPGESVTLGEGGDAETAKILSITRRGAPSVTLAEPLKRVHPGGATFAGSGLTFTTPLNNAHAAGAPLASASATPGSTNKSTP